MRRVKHRLVPDQPVGPLRRATLRQYRPEYEDPGLFTSRPSFDSRHPGDPAGGRLSRADGRSTTRRH
jgi:hypothetical protein